MSFLAAQAYYYYPKMKFFCYTNNIFISSPSGTVTNEASKSTDDAMFDIITDEEVGQIQEGDSDQSKNQTEESLDHDVPDL